MLQSQCLIIFTACFALDASKITNDPTNELRSFPDWFEFGAATAAYQIEGGWNEDGKSESIWDVISHSEPCVIEECCTGDIADDSYHQVSRDVEMIRELGLDYYRFSIAWTRILPTSFPDKINEAGVKYYNNLINELLKYNIKPMVTLYHFDLPQKLQDMGGWTNPNIVEWFSDYARICFQLFGDRVSNWITINEPREVCYQREGEDFMAPIINYGDGVADYMCARNLLLAHAKAYHIYDEEFRPRYGGVVGIALSMWWYEAASDSEDDIAAAESVREFEWGLYANPIFSESGDFPAVVKDKISKKSAEQGYPEFTLEELDYIKGSADYLGVNHYTSAMATRNYSVSGYHPVPSMYDYMDAITFSLDEWVISPGLPWLKVVPWGFYKLLIYIRDNYNNPPVYITENGYSTTGGLEDDDRISYYYQYLEAMLDAIEEGCDVRGYIAWSLMDNFEWISGYTAKFGLYEMDFSDPLRTRMPRKSAFVYKQIVGTRQLDPTYEPPKDRVMTIDNGH